MKEVESDNYLTIQILTDPTHGPWFVPVSRSTDNREFGLSYKPVRALEYTS